MNSSMGLMRSTMSNGISTTTTSRFGEQAKLTAEEEQAAQELFEAYDYDGRGAINVQALRDLLSEANWCLDEELRNELIVRFCANGDQIEFDSFLSVFRAMLALQPSSVRKRRAAFSRIDVTDLRRLEADARETFEALDERGTGFLGLHMMKEILRGSGFPDVDGDDYDGVLAEQMRLADANQDGLISFEEFVGYRNAVIQHLLVHAEEDQSSDRGVPEDPWAWEHFAH